jgi:glycerophosphoryl diester phosphodiesterase
VTIVLAHRGARRLAPENTLAAFGRALALGAHGVELDVRRTADDALVVRHDATGPVGPWVGATLDAIRAAVPDVPALTEVLDACRGRLVNIEIKSSPLDPDWDPSRRVADLVVACLEDRDGGDHVLVSSFDVAAVDRVRARAPHVATALLTAVGDPLDALAAAESHGHRALHPSLAQVAGDRAGALVQHAHERGLRVNVWTVNDDSDISRLAVAGVDGICTDVPDVALSVLARRA